jgi:hypothetical protein
LDASRRLARREKEEGQVNNSELNINLLLCYFICCVIVLAKLMRFPLVKADTQGYYHCVSRVVEGDFIFEVSGHGSVEAERFIKLMRRLEAFSGVRVLTYVLMSNYFHLLCEIPEPKVLSEAEVLERVEAGYGPARRQALQQEIARHRQQRMEALRSSTSLIAIADVCRTSRSLPKNSKADLPSGTTSRNWVLWAERFKHTHPYDLSFFTPTRPAGACSGSCPSIPRFAGSSGCSRRVSMFNAKTFSRDAFIFHAA